MAGRRGFETVRDMVLSLGVVLAVVGLVLLMTIRQEPDGVRVVDPQPELAIAAAGAPYPVLVPGTPQGWQVTSARTTPPGSQPFRWHVGYLTDTGTYAAAGQSNGRAAVYLESENAAGRTTGARTVDGVRWTVVERSDGRRTSLVRTQDGVTTLVTGTGSVEQLETLAGTLETASRAADRLTPSAAPATTSG